MKKALFTLNIGNYAPELRRVSYPLMKHYAKKIGADFVEIRERRWPDWPVVYEKLQLRDLARGYDWIIFMDADALVHPDTPDWSGIVPRKHVAFFGFDFAPTRWTLDKYFYRDRRMIGTPGWLTMAWGECRDKLWRPSDLPLEEVLWRVHPTVNEVNLGMAHEHFVDDYTLSRNIARWHIPAVGLMALMQKFNLVANYYAHQYDHETVAEKYQMFFKVVMGAEAFGEHYGVEITEKDRTTYPGWKLPKGLVEGLGA